MKPLSGHYSMFFTQLFIFKFEPIFMSICEFIRLFFVKFFGLILVLGGFTMFLFMWMEKANFDECSSEYFMSLLSELANLELFYIFFSYLEVRKVLKYFIYFTCFLYFLCFILFILPLLYFFIHLWLHSILFLYSKLFTIFVYVIFYLLYYLILI